MGGSGIEGGRVDPGAFGGRAVGPSPSRGSPGFEKSVTAAQDTGGTEGEPGAAGMLARLPEWVTFECPRTGRTLRRETLTMPQWAGSCWYYLMTTDLVISCYYSLLDRLSSA